MVKAFARIVFVARERGVRRMVCRPGIGYEATMAVGRGFFVLAAALLLPIACEEKKERAPLAPPLASVSSPYIPAAASSAPVAELSSAVPSTMASAAPSASASAASPIASASTSASTAASTTAPGPLATKLVGYWMFAKFDLTDAATASKWNAIPESMQKEILAEAPKATIEFTKDKLISRLTGVPDKISTWSVESEDPNDLVIKTSDEGRKKIRFATPDQIRIEELDKKGSFVTLFARTTKPAPAPSASASGKP